MTPEQALQIVDQYLAQIAVNRQCHHQIQNAMGVLGAIVAKEKMRLAAEAKKKDEEKLKAESALKVPAEEKQNQ